MRLISKGLTCIDPRDKNSHLEKVGVTEFEQLGLILRTPDLPDALKVPCLPGEPAVVPFAPGDLATVPSMPVSEEALRTPSKSLPPSLSTLNRFVRAF